MVKEKKMASIVIVSLLFVLLCACTKQLDFDAKSYVQSFLDAEYHREYADYANLMEISEEDVKKQVEEDFNESIRQQGKDCTGNERNRSGCICICFNGKRAEEH